jgi:hypothetical protein
MKEADMSVPPTLSPELRNRIGRQRMVIGGLVAAAATVIVIGGFAGARSLSRDDAPPPPPAEEPSPSRSVETIVEGNGAVRSRAVLELCEFLFTECTPRPMMPEDGLVSVEVSVTGVGTGISGSGLIEGGGHAEAFQVRCARQVEVNSIAVAGTFGEGEWAGRAMAVVINDLDPDSDRLAIWFERNPPGDGGCESTLDGLEERGWENLTYEPLSGGNFTIGGETSGPTPQELVEPVEVINLLGGNVTLRDEGPWTEHIEWSLISDSGGPESLLLLDNATGSASIAQLLVIADPAPAEALDAHRRDCWPRGGTVVSAQAFAAALRAHTGLVSTDPVIEQIAGVDAFRLDVAPAKGAFGCDSVGATWVSSNGDTGVPVVRPSRATYFGPPSGAFVVPDGMRMRLYLLDAPGGDARVLAIAILAAEEDFNTAVEAAQPILDSIRIKP